MVRPVLVTGFMPYGGRGVNPAAEIAAALEGRTLADTPVVSRLLPVSFAKIAVDGRGLCSVTSTLASSSASGSGRASRSSASSGRRLTSQTSRSFGEQCRPCGG